MDGLVVLLMFGVVGFVLVGPILAVISLARLSGLERRLGELETQARVTAAREARLRGAAHRFSQFHRQDFSFYDHPYMDI